jgi:hypothetical protein
MITVSRTKEKVVIKVNLEIPDYTIPFEFSRSHELDAELLERFIREKLWGRIEDIKRVFYEKGYKDGRSKKDKKDYFSCRLEADPEF